MVSKRPLFFLALVLTLLITGFLYNFYRLKREWENFFRFTLEEETRRIGSALRATLAAGGDPVETLADYLADSRLLQGAALILSGRTIVVPGSEIPPHSLVRTLEIAPFRFRLYFSGETFYEVKRHLYWELGLWGLLNLTGLLVTLWFLRSYYRSLLALAHERAESERLRSISLAVSSVLHEVKNTLNNLNFALYRLSKNCPGEETRILREEIRRLGQFLQEVSDLRKPLKLHLEIQRPDQEIAKVLEEFQEGLEKLGIILEVRFEEAQIPLDPEKMRLVWRNLLKNALEALSESPPPRKLRLRGYPKEGFYVVEIGDSAGLLPEDPAELFRPYKSNKPGGFGLGLFNVKRIVEAHGGRILATKEEGFSLFRIFLPLGKISED